MLIEGTTPLSRVPLSQTGPTALTGNPLGDGRLANKILPVTPRSSSLVMPSFQAETISYNDSRSGGRRVAAVRH